MDRRIAALVEEVAAGRAPSAGPEAYHALLGSLHEGESVRAAIFSLFAAEDAPPPPAAHLRPLLTWVQSGMRAYRDPRVAAVVHDGMLALMEPLQALIPTLLRELRDPDPFVHSAAARDIETLTHFLGPIGPDDGSLGEALRGALADPCADVRCFAAAALANLQEDADANVPALAALLSDPSRIARWAAVEALGGFGAEAREAVPALAALLRDADTTVSLRAATALAQIGGTSAEVLDGLLHLARSAEAGTRLHGLLSLAALPAPTRESVDALRAAAEKDPDEGIRKAAAEGLQRLLQRHGSL
jgi:HEAT repeat protein